MLALAVSQCTEWLRDLERRNVEKESDKFVMMASIILVHCVAHADAHDRALTNQGRLKVQCVTLTELAAAGSR